MKGVASWQKRKLKFLYNNKTYTKQAVYAVKPDIAWNFYTAEVLSEINTLLVPLLEETSAKTTLKECLNIEKKFIAHQKSILKTNSTQTEMSK